MAVRLMPQEPRAWNHLGLAYQAAGQPRQAIEAYRQALVRDRSNLVFHAHYNLGCVFFEQGQMPAAIEEFRSFLMLSNSLPARLKLAQAHQRLRQWNEAENNFQAVLRQQPRSAAALNGAGIVRSQLGRTHEAAQYFEAAVQADPKAKYPPALFNLATLYAQQSGLRTLAIERYREYLRLKPAPPEAAAAEAALRQLEASLAPVVTPLPPNPMTQSFAWTPRVPLIPTNGASLTPPRVAATGAVLVTTQGAVTLPLSLPGRAAVETNSVARTNAPTPEPVVKLPVAPARNETAPTNVPPAVVLAQTNAAPPHPAPPPPPRTPATPASANAAPLTPPPTAVAIAPVVTSSVPLTVVQWSDAPPPKPAQDLVESTARSAGRTPATLEANPYKKPDALMSPVPWPKAGTVSNPAPARLAAGVGAQKGTIGPGASVASLLTTRPARLRPSYPRYPYRPSVAPVAGDRAQAIRLYQQAAQAQQSGQWEEARRTYWQALQTDPSFFEAAANAGFAAYQRGNWPQALACYESAVAIKPESLNTRYSFALALAQGGYPVDAAQELEKVLQGNSSEARAHLALGNLEAEKLLEPDKARGHYLKVIELDPRNPQVSALRTWLATHP